MIVQQLITNVGRQRVKKRARITFRYVVVAGDASEFDPPID